MSFICRTLGHKYKFTKVVEIMFGVYDCYHECQRCGYECVFIYRTYNVMSAGFFSAMSVPPIYNPHARSDEMRKIICFLFGHKHVVTKIHDRLRYVMFSHITCEKSSAGYCERCGFTWDDQP